VAQPASAPGQIDRLIGGAGLDTFVLGGSWGVSYVEDGDGYAVIEDWQPGLDQIEVKGGTGGTYSLTFTAVSGIGGAALDTEIYFTSSSGSRDRIAIVQDSTNVIMGLDFVYV
jgi:hypothetical protein